MKNYEKDNLAHIVSSVVDAWVNQGTMFYHGYGFLAFIPVFPQYKR